MEALVRDLDDIAAAFADLAGDVGEDPGPVGDLEVQAQQAYIQQSAQLQNLYTGMAKGLAERAVQSNDQQLLAMLAAQGLKVTPPAGNAAPKR